MRTFETIFAAASAAFLLVACDKSSTSPAPANTAIASVAAPTPAPKPPVPEDLDVAALQTSLKCPGSAYKAVCELLEDFKTAGAWNTDTIRGVDARYFGKGFNVQDDKAEEQLYFMVAKKVPLNETAPGDLPLKLVFRTVDSTLANERAAAPKLLRLLERDDAVGKGNQTAIYLSSYAVSHWDSVSASKGVSTFAQFGSGAYVRMAGGRKLILVNPTPLKPGGKVGEGAYSVLYPVSW